MKVELTQKELKRKLHYNPKTGIFTWLIKNSNRILIGSIAGCLCSDGYIRIGINGKNYSAHRLAHLYMKGYWPEHEIDHKFGIRDDNRWLKIQHVTKSCNLQNQKISKNNTSGFPGVTLDKRTKMWQSQIKVNYKLIKLGLYNDPLEAALARFTFEMQCSQWTCNYRSELVKAIKNAWPEFKFGYHK